MVDGLHQDRNNIEESDKVSLARNPVTITGSGARGGHPLRDETIPGRNTLPSTLMT